MILLILTSWALITMGLCALSHFYIKSQLSDILKQVESEDIDDFKYGHRSNINEWKGEWR